jgi:hypothetical protein
MVVSSRLPYFLDLSKGINKNIQIFNVPKEIQTEEKLLKFSIVSLSLLVELEKYPLLPVSSTPSAEALGGPWLAPAAAPVVGPKCRSSGPSGQELSECGPSWHRHF